MACSIEFFKQFPIFKDLSYEELLEVGKISHQRSLSRGKRIFNEGEERTAVYFVVSGLIKIYKVSEDGQEQVINLLKSNEMFPHVGFFDDTPYPATALTLTDAELIVVPIEGFELLLLQKPQISIKVMRVIGKKLLALQERIQHMSTQTVSQRTVSTLIRLSEELGEEREDSSVYVNIPITNTDLANMIGVTRESVNRTFNRLKKEDIMSYNRRKIIIHDLEKLQTYEF
ncbi:Crp/Fnr family transcriptional regulator [Alkalibacillus aidingensis]|uniref:Crp/Fnr family transcriptional regulator n=1 Tax=Alkalibacillus aidingensis TaxID=2747607 RepID=UPI0016603A42|nr:Crp/Fnr family transcriptional regulator [Alkalibacillus aidingensis]